MEQHFNIETENRITLVDADAEGQGRNIVSTNNSLCYVLTTQIFKLFSLKLIYFKFEFQSYNKFVPANYATI